VRPQVRTVPYPEDMEVLAASIAQAKTQADLVVASFHWGTASAPAVLLDYERILGHAAVDAGADAVFGHHHHYLRGVELYGGKPIFYGLGHFAFDLPGMEESLTAHELSKLKAMGEHAIYPREGYPLLPFHPDARMTGVAVCAMDGASPRAIGLLPCVINAANQPVPFAADSAEGQRVLDYVRQISEEAGLPTRYAADGPVVAGMRSIGVR